MVKLKTTAAAGVMLYITFLSVGLGFCQEPTAANRLTQIVEQIGDKGKINWSAGYIEALGIGAPPEIYTGKPQARPLALRAAKIDACRNLLEVTNGVRVDSATLVKDFAAQGDVILAQVNGLVRGAKVVNQEYMSAGTVEVTVRMPLFGNFLRIIVPKAFDRKAEVSLANVSPAIPVPEELSARGVVYTGVVIDARGIKARPAMSPRIIDESGKEIYGFMNVDREYAVQQGMIGYARGLAAAQKNPRVAGNPVTVKGLKTEGSGRSDIVISNADAKKITVASDEMGFLKKCAVMIVLD
jgi:hypothetical protein